jgi:hypothetical protein
MSSSYPGSPKARDPGHPPVFGKRTGKDPGAPTFIGGEKDRGTCFLGEGWLAGAGPEVVDEGVGHAGDVVGDGAGEALGGDLGLVVGGQECGRGGEGGEEVFDDAGGEGVVGFHAGGVIEAGVEESLGGGASLFHLRGEGGEALGGEANAFERIDAAAEDAGAGFI